MRTVLVEWDLDSDSDASLPMVIDVPEDVYVVTLIDTEEDHVSGFLSDNFGFMVKGWVLA